MNRSVKYLTCLVSLAGAHFSCEDRLEEEPFTFLNKDAVYSTEKGVASAVVGLYYTVAELYRHELHHYLQPHSGKFTSRSGVVAAINARMMALSPSDSYLNRAWGDCYRGINVANDMIVNLADAPVNETVKQHALGEAHFIRGFMYFNLVRLWGGVPLRLEPATTGELHTPRASAEEVYEVIVSDLEKAKDWMPGPGEGRNDRPHKYAAYSLLAKVYLTMASMSQDEQTPYWQRAYDEAITVYNEGPYELVRPYSDLWVPENANTKEAIFEVQMGPEINSNFLTLHNPPYHPLLEGAGGGGQLRVNKETFDDHVEQYPDDPRIQHTYAAYSYVRSDNGTTRNIYPNSFTDLGWPYLLKYYDPSVNPNGSQGNKNFIFLRYADLLLMLAEIENELNGPDAAYKYVNDVLARARDTNGDGADDAVDPADWSGMSREEFRMRIMQERHYELLGELHDWFDVRRRGYAYFLENVIRKHNNHPTFAEGYDNLYPEDERNMLLPIPSNEINTNQDISSADQNTGY